MVKKHKKLKLVDPECKRQVEPKVESQFNNAPVNFDNQEVPRKMQMFIDMKNDPFSIKKRKRKSRRTDSLVVHKTFMGEDLPGMTKPMQKVPDVMAQRESESVSHFLGRIQDLANQYNSEAKIEDKFGIGEPEYELGTGKVERGNRKREKRKLLKKKQKEKKMKKLEDDKDETLVKEHIPFGEIAMAPPVFTGLKVKKEKQQAGMRNLLLKSSYPSQKLNTSVLSMKKKSELETERKKAVELYRMMKARKQAVLNKNK